MKLTDVLKKPDLKFRRPSFKPFNGQPTWLKQVDNRIVFANTGTVWSPRPEDITASDWELEEIRKEFTFNEIYDAVQIVADKALDEKQFKTLLKTSLGFSDGEQKVEWGSPTWEDYDSMGGFDE